MKHDAGKRRKYDKDIRKSKKEYILLKALLTVAGVNLTELDRIKE